MARKPHSTSLVLLLVCIFAFWWGISVLSQYTGTPLNVSYSSLQQGSLFVQQPLKVEQDSTGDTYRYSGTFMPISMCDSFGSGIKYSASDGGHVSVILITSPALAACAQAATSAEMGDPFNVSIKVPAGTQPVFDGILLNGSIIPSELVVAN